MLEDINKTTALRHETKKGDILVFPWKRTKKTGCPIFLLLHNVRHPSLQAKKYDEARDIWQARVNGGWRFYFRIEGDTYILLDMIPHPK